MWRRSMVRRYNTRKKRGAKTDRAHTAKQTEKQKKKTRRQPCCGVYARAGNCVDDSPVVLAGDLNATSFQKLRGIANAVTLLLGSEHAGRLHPFAFDCKELPGHIKTSVTAARDVRIDALLYQSQRLILTDSRKAPKMPMKIASVASPSTMRVSTCAVFLPRRTSWLRSRTGPAGTGAHSVACSVRSGRPSASGRMASTASAACKPPYRLRPCSQRSSVCACMRAPSASSARSVARTSLRALMRPRAR